MTDHDPPAGLDEVPWARLRHSYGTADDVPGHLRAMRGDGVWEGQYPPIGQLAHHIVHQGKRDSPWPLGVEEGMRRWKIPTRRAALRDYLRDAS
ncbi:hypothetical protein ACIP9H_18975 [Streptomyces sp. NPDC088732]|uniref:hypothetical protein n=1 Tax=Streptomyces sp. NPDC088732 TaxID=3365879 RepID=UPI0037F322E9